MIQIKKIKFKWSYVMHPDAMMDIFYVFCYFKENLSIISSSLV